MNETPGARALLQRVAQGKTTALDADRLRQWLFPGEQAQTVNAYLLLTCNAEQVKAHIAPDLRLNLAVRLLSAWDDASDRLALGTLLADAIKRYDEYQEQHGYERDEACQAATRATLDGLAAEIEQLKEGRQ